MMTAVRPADFEGP